MTRFLYFVLLAALFSSCETGSLTSTPSEPEGKWVLKGYRNRVSDCPYDQVTLEISRKEKGYEITGRSFINTYFSDAEISYNVSDQSGTITFSGIGSTKMGGPEHLMLCEADYYQLLGSSATLKIENQHLHLSRVSRPEELGLPEVLIFERNKK